MSALDPADADRFGKIISLFDSTVDGERHAAISTATKWLADRKMKWVDIGEMLKCPPVIYRPEPARAPRSHQMDARQLLASGIQWKAHELQFLRQMATQLRKPTEKQRDWLDGLLDRARSKGGS